MINISIHASNGLEICREMPSNSGHLKLRSLEQYTTSGEFDLYVSLDQWWALRKVLPKSSDYTMTKEVRAGGQYIFTKDHTDADAYAAEFYYREMAKRADAAQSVDQVMPGAAGLA